MIELDSETGVSAPKTFITNDLSFAAYLVMKGIKLVNAQKLGHTFKFEFLYEPQINNHSISYIGSEVSRFDDAVRKLKRLVYAGEGVFSNGDKDGNYI